MYPDSKRKVSGILLRISVAAVLVLLLLNKLNYHEIINLLSNLNLGYLSISVALVVLAIVLSAYKWQILLVARGWQIPLMELIKVYFVGLFMNNFLPSSIGGDLMRIYQVGKKIDNYSAAAASVILERVLATVGLAIPAFVAIFPNRSLLGGFIYPVFWFFVICVLLVYLTVHPAVLRPIARLPWKGWQNVILKLRDINAVIQSYRSKPLEILRVTIYSVIFQMTMVLINYYLLRATGIEDVGLWHCTLMVPIISAVSMIPVSINGLGIREGAYVILFGNLGMSASQSVTLSMIFFFIVTAVSLLGGFIFILEKDKEDYLVTDKRITECSRP